MKSLGSKEVEIRLQIPKFWLEIYETPLESAEIHETRPACLEIRPKTPYKTHILKILDIAVIREVHPKNLKIPEIRPKIPEILKSAVQTLKE